MEDDRRESAGESILIPSDIKRGILIVEAEHQGWMQLLQLQQDRILEEIELKFPDLKIRGIAFKLGNPGGATNSGSATGSGSAINSGSATGSGDDSPWVRVEAGSRSRNLKRKKYRMIKLARKRPFHQIWWRCLPESRKISRNSAGDSIFAGLPDDFRRRACRLTKPDASIYTHEPALRIPCGG